MKTVPNGLLDGIKTASVLRAEPRVIVDWNLNRYIGVTASNTPSEDTDGYDIELFPIESIVDVEIPRPTKGVNKARVGQSTVASDYFENNGNGRYYICGVDDVYKYWTSPYAADGSANISSVLPRIEYDANVKTNKIVIKVENSMATPLNFTIDTYNGSTWTNIANQTTLGNSWKSNGMIVLYWDGDSWGAGPRVDNVDGLPVTTTIRGVRMGVTKLQGGYKTEGTLVPTTYRTQVGSQMYEYETTGAYSHFDLIEMAAHLEADVSEHVIEFDDTQEISESSILYPIGTLTSNSGKVILSNIYPDGTSTGLFSRRNTDPNILWTEYLEPNAEVTVSLDYYDEGGTFLGNVPQFVGYSEGWSGQESDEVEVELLDFSKFFNSIIVPASLWEDLTVPQIVWRILDQTGFVNYDIDRDADRVTEHKIPVFYTDGESTVWEVLDELAQASQTAIYFDSTGRLQVKTRDFAFSDGDTPVWTFTSELDGGYVENVIGVSQDEQFEPNYIKCIYQKTNWSDWNNGQPSMQMVWQPEGTETLRSTPLRRSIDADDMTIHIGSGTVALWPFASKVNIQGEIISYDAKQLVYYTGSSGNVSHTEWVTNADHAKELTNLTPPQYAYKNYYTGALRLTERGVWNSDPRNHSVDASGYVVHGRVGHTHYSSGVGGFTHIKNESRVQLSSPGRVLDANDWVIASQTSDGNYKHYGMRFRFVPGGGSDQMAGIVICEQGSGNGGYFIEFQPSSKLDSEKLKSRKELHIYSRDGSGTPRTIEGVAARRISIGENIDYEVDVYHSLNAGVQRINVWVNGKSVINKIVPEDAEIALTGKFGMFIRGKSTAKFDYLYAIGRDDAEPPDEFGFLDKVDRGYTGSQWDREWTYRWRSSSRRIKKTWTKAKARWNAQFFDEFGPYVHEIREYDVKFDPFPVLHSRIYSSNDWGAAVLEYSGNPHGGKFIIANTSRTNSVVNGDDSLSFAGTGQSVNQTLCVFGRVLIVEEAEEVLAINESQVRRRGRIESELTSPWMQTKHMAQDLAAWIADHWSYGDSNISVSTYGNPLLQIGDVVNVNIPEKYISGTFFVTGINTGWDNGVTSEFRLRRRS
jgi:hypothetical protein